jgi:hypothetical protein
VKEMKRFRKGQSTLEYVIILAAVIGTIILVAGIIGGHLNNGYSSLSDKMQNKADEVDFSK